jgi:hypothetical protein
MRGRTISSKEKWQSPDGKRTIWEVVLEVDGHEQTLSTFSSRISQVGFEGELTTYKNDRGDTFVKQPQQQGGYGGGGGGGTYQPRDDAAIRGQWAIGRAIETIDWKDPKLDLSHVLTLVERRAKAFYDLVDRVKDHGGKEAAS